MGEILCRAYGEMGLKIVILRISAPYGFVSNQSVISRFLNLVKKGKNLELWGSGSRSQVFTFVEDIVDGLYRAGNEYFKSCEEFELGTGKNCSINDLTGWFGNYPTKSIPKRDGEMRESLCTDTHAHDLLNWKPRTYLKDYIQDFVETEKFLNE